MQHVCQARYMLYVCYTPGIVSKRLIRSSWFSAQKLLSDYRLILCYNGTLVVSAEIRVLFSGTLSQTRNFADFFCLLLRSVSRRKFCQVYHHLRLQHTNVIHSRAVRPQPPKLRCMAWASHFSTRYNRLHF